MWTEQRLAITKAQADLITTALLFLAADDACYIKELEDEEHWKQASKVRARYEEAVRLAKQLKEFE